MFLILRKTNFNILISLQSFLEKGFSLGIEPIYYIILPFWIFNSLPIEWHSNIPSIRPFGFKIFHIIQYTRIEHMYNIWQYYLYSYRTYLQHLVVLYILSQNICITSGSLQYTLIVHSIMYISSFPCWSCIPPVCIPHWSEL